MENQTIILQPLVVQKLNYLFDTLIFKGYFSYAENATAYIEGLKDFIKSIPEQKPKPTHNKQPGSWYCKYKPNNNTTWYISFDTDGSTFLIRNIFNNHSEEYPIFIKTF
jgi:hypothetical protein